MSGQNHPEDILAQKRLWEDTHREKRDDFKTQSGIPVQRLYTPCDAEVNYLNDLGFPGQYPYTRGISPDMYREKLWVLGNYSGYGTAEETNERFKYLIKNGETSLSIALDLPTQMGYDSDHPLALGEVGRVGVAINSLEDFEQIFDGIPMENSRLVTTANAISPIILAMFIALAEKRGVGPDTFVLNLQNDILKEYMARGTYIFPVEAGLKCTIDTVEYCCRNIPNWVPINFCGYHIREAGSAAHQEVAYTIANALVYINLLLQRGLSIDQFAPQVATVFMAVQMDFCEEIAKFRAMRRIWAKLLRDKLGARDPRSWRLAIRTYTAGSALTAKQPHNNLIRVAVMVLAGALGGVQRIAASSMDEALCLPSEEAVRLAMRTQQIIAGETGVTNTVDPLGGSYYIEYLTDTIEAMVNSELEKIEGLGGAVNCIKSGLLQKEITAEAYRQHNMVREGKKTIVGVNKYIEEENVTVKPFIIDPKLEEKQIRKLNSLRERRDNAGVKIVLNKVREAASEGANIVPAVLEAVKAYATVGEICDALRDVYGTFEELSAL
ncbi:MAG: acyl-CoA mutase large subunit family protein [Bacillota bacterium]